MKLNLNFLNQYPSNANLESIFSSIVDALFERLEKTDISIITFGSITKGEFSFNANSKRKTLSDIELLVIANKYESNILKFIYDTSANLENRWFPYSELFHIDIRITTPKELIGRDNLFPFRSSETIYGNFDCEILHKKPYPLEILKMSIIEKMIFQIYIMQEIHKNEEASFYLLAKLFLIILEFIEKQTLDPELNAVQKQIIAFKQSLDFNYSNIVTPSKLKDLIIRQFQSLESSDSYFGIENIISFFRSSSELKTSNRKANTLENFTSHYLENNFTQKKYFKNLFELGKARR